MRRALGLRMMPTLDTKVDHFSTLGVGPAQTATKNTTPPKQQNKPSKTHKQQKINTTLPLPKLLHSRKLISSKKHNPAQTALFGQGACFFAVWAGGSCLFLLFGRTGDGACFFAVWAALICWFIVLLFGRGTGVHSLTGLPARLSGAQQQKRPNNSNTKNTGSRPGT